MGHPLFERHQDMLHGALEAIRTRSCWSAFPEIPSGKIYGDSAGDDGAAAYQHRLNKPFPLDQPGSIGFVGDEVSPYGGRLGISYPRADLEVLPVAATQAANVWRREGVEARVGVCLEILHRLNRRSFELAHAVMHTTGQGFMMAFQAGGPHAQDRGLEAVTLAYQEQTRFPADTAWEKQVSKTETVRLRKRYRIVPRGVGAVVGCSTFPTWNAYPGLFANLATGNAVVVKPHPGAILPLAITVETAREVFREQGLDANIVTLFADSREAPVTGSLVIRPEVRIVDYTGSSAFGEWIERNAAQAAVFAEKAGVNGVILDSVEDLRAVAANLAFSMSLYSGQMCTTPQNVFLPQGGIKVGAERQSFDEVASAIVGAVDRLLSDPARAAEILGAIQNEETAQRVDHAEHEGAVVLRRSAPVPNARFPEARVRSPLILKVDAADRHLYMREMFGPITYLVATRDTNESIALAAETARTRGAITGAVYSTNEQVLHAAAEELTQAGVNVSCNLTGQIYVNQAAAYSDFHVSGANPAGNATLCDPAFVLGRFRFAQSREPA